SGIPGEIGDVAIGPLVMIDSETLTVDPTEVLTTESSGRRRRVVERIDLVVVPVAPGAIGINLALERDVAVKGVFQPAAQPKLAREAVVVEDVVVGRERARIDGHRLERASVAGEIGAGV